MHETPRLLWLFIRISGNLLNDVAKRFNLTPIQYFALRFIGLHDRPTLGAVADAIDASNAAATKLIDRLVEKDLTTRSRGPEDQRERHLSLTDKGWVTLAEVRSEQEKGLERIVAGMNEKDRRNLLTGLEAFMAAAVKDPAQIRRACLRCGEEHTGECPGDKLYRRLGGPPRKV